MYKEDFENVIPFKKQV